MTERISDDGRVEDARVRVEVRITAGAYKYSESLLATATHEVGGLLAILDIQEALETGLEMAGLSANCQLEKHFGIDESEDVEGSNRNGDPPY